MAADDQPVVRCPATSQFSKANKGSPIFSVQMSDWGRSETFIKADIWPSAPKGVFRSSAIAADSTAIARRDRAAPGDHHMKGASIA
jgi:hypothetical protein